MDAQRIATKLWMGSYPRGPVRYEFNALVLCAKELQEHFEHPDPPRILVRVPLDDHEPTPAEVKLALRGARRVNELRRQGLRVLVTCAQGINRSGLVVALALVLDGMPAAQAIQAVRQGRRHPAGVQALRNPHFVKVISNVDRAARKTRQAHGLAPNR
jgi:protein-tyrosine phosphatase